MFLLTRFLNNGRSQQSKAAFFTSLVIWFAGDLFIHTTFLYVHLVDNYDKNVDERGRDFMGKRTLLSLLLDYKNEQEQLVL